MPAELEQRVDAVLGHLEPALGQALDLALREVVEGELGEGGAAPEREGGVEPRKRFRRISVFERTLPFGRQAREACCVDLIVLDLQHVPGRPRREHRRAVLAEQPTEMRDVALDRLGRCARRPLAPERVDERVHRHDLAAAQEQGHEQRPLPTGRKPDLVALRVVDLERAEDPELHPTSPISEAISGFRGVHTDFLPLLTASWAPPSTLGSSGRCSGEPGRRRRTR